MVLKTNLIFRCSLTSTCFTRMVLFVYENVISQKSSIILTQDIQKKTLPPSLLFYGPIASGKLTTALETARILSCNNPTAPWECTCSSCLAHKQLVHPDVVLIGPKNSFLEIQASSAAFLRSENKAAHYLFIRSVRKLLMRFSVNVQDKNDSKLLKASALLLEIEELLDELSVQTSMVFTKDVLEKKVQTIVNVSKKLEDGFIQDSIPVSQIRAINSWARLTPNGKCKIIIIENADKMQDSARNAFLKILEEPPALVSFILTTTRKNLIIPTILSRLRSYSFIDRNPSQNSEVIKRVFHDIPNKNESLDDYFNRFLPVSLEVVESSAFSFLQYILDSAIDEGRRPIEGLYAYICTSKNQIQDSSLSTIQDSLLKFKPVILWDLFLKYIARILKQSLQEQTINPREIEIYHKWNTYLKRARESQSLYNISTLSNLESLFISMKDAI